MRFLFRTLILIAAVAAFAIFGGYFALRLSLPQTEGELRLRGIAAPVEILRDAYGIPHIFARSVEDAHFALGFVHAQDRLWQMEMNRRIGSGRLAEVLGARALETDRFMRTLGVRRAAEENLKHYDAETRRALDAYAAGVNAYLGQARVLPPEFLILRVAPEPWTPADSVVWTKMMAWDLGGNWRNELLRMRLAARFPNARIHEFLPPYPGDAAPEITDLKELYRSMGEDVLRLADSAERLAALFPGAREEAMGSNSWVVSGERSASGKPLLANDPHLGLTAPSVWYLAHLSAPGLDAIGATLPGVPAIVIGRNERIAWGLASTGPDVQDLYLEKVDRSGRYLAPDGPRPFALVEERIRVRGGDEERLTVRVSRHGPVISDASRRALEAAPRGHVLAFAWTALAADDLTMQAALKVARAGNWNEFLAAARDFHTPQQSVTYADVEGNIGFMAAGRVPLRKPDNDLKGLAPAPGWDARYDWAGTIPFEELPREFNPARGTIVTANHKIVPAGYPHHITAEWQPPYRALRIAELLDALPAHAVPSFARIQADAVSPAARELLPRLAATRPRSEEARAALRLLAAWDGTMAAERAEPLIAAAWWRELTRALYADELGDAFRLNWSPRAQFVANVLADREGQSRWCDDVRTRPVETCEELLALSLEAALADLRARYGPDMAAWRWGRAHAARHRHRPFGRESFLGRFFEFSVPTPGDTYSVNVGRYDLFDDEEPFANRHAASLRAIVDLADPERSLYIHSGGQSGHLLSAHYRSFAEAWARGEYIPMTTGRARLEAAGVQRLVLAPLR